jgi:hypothetical protein
VQATTVSSAPQPAPSQITQRIRERAAATHPQAAEESMRPAAPARRAPQARTAPQETPDTRTENGVPAWKRRIVDELSTELDRRGASRGTRASDRLTAENVDARITGLSQEIRSRNRAGYDQPGASRIGVVVNRAV